MYLIDLLKQFINCIFHKYIYKYLLVGFYDTIVNLYKSSDARSTYFWNPHSNIWRSKLESLGVFPYTFTQIFVGETIEIYNVKTYSIQKLIAPKEAKDKKVLKCK